MPNDKSVSLKQEENSKSTLLREIINCVKTSDKKSEDFKTITTETTNPDPLTFNAAIQTSPEVKNFGVQVSSKKASKQAQTEGVERMLPWCSFQILY